jgi:hypothetical protein
MIVLKNSHMHMQTHHADISSLDSVAIMDNNLVCIQKQAYNNLGELIVYSYAYMLGFKF